MISLPGINRGVLLSNGQIGPKCGGGGRHARKWPYVSEEFAWLAADRAMDYTERTSTLVFLGIYNCDVCGFWHLYSLREPFDIAEQERLRKGKKECSREG